MTREAVGAALLLLGAVVLRLTITGEYLSFVKSSLAVPLVLSAVVLLALGVAELRASVREQRAREDVDGAAHASGATPASDAVDTEVGAAAGHHHVGAGPRMGALLLAPVAVLMLVPAVPLGAFAADNGATNRVAEVEVYGDLPPGGEDGAVELVLPELTGRALVEPGPLAGTPVRTIGFVVPDEQEPGTYLLSRFTVGCCAVDAAPYQLRVRAGDAGVPEREEWVEVVVRFTGEVDEVDQERIPVFELVDQQPIDEPEVPYVY